MTNNPMLLIDGYKLDHRRQYPTNTRRVYSNWTPRSSRISDQKEVVFFGLQYFLQKYLMSDMATHFFQLPVEVVCKEYKQFCDQYLGPNNIGTDHIRALHKLGFIPLEFRALYEGTLCPIGVPMLTVENTHNEFAWLVNYVETLMSNILWMPCTSATNAYRLRKLLSEHAMKTVGHCDFVPWQGHDFSMRGMAGVEAAMLSGAGHLLSFKGSDTIPAISFLKEYYGPTDSEFIAGSVPASEHSTACANADADLDESKYVERMLDLYPNGIVSMVSDTYDLWKLLTVTLPKFKDRIMSRNGKLVCRPDSGIPEDIICGNPKSSDPNAKLGVIQLLWNIFGGKINSQGYKELDPHVGCIYGDAITYDRANEICRRLAENGFASTNMVYGVGSFTYQYVTRDTFGFAMKATWANVEGEGRPLFKKPVTDNGAKFSARGRLNVVRDANGTLTLQQNVQNHDSSLLEVVWRDGIFLRKQNLSSVRSVLWY